MGWLDSLKNNRGADLAILILAVSLPLLGLIGIVVYTEGGSRLGVGFLAAVAATAVGLLFGLLFGVPRYVSSGQARLAAKKPPAGDGEQGAKAADTSSSADATGGMFAPSTNLAEVSDWLTKLLLGAGLVSLTKLGAPLAHLVDSVGAGLSPSGVATDSSKLVAGSIIFGFTALGFLYGYMLTTTWYKQALEEDGDNGVVKTGEEGDKAQEVQPKPDPTGVQAPRTHGHKSAHNGEEK
jgi:hypothetical protein